MGLGGGDGYVGIMYTKGGLETEDDDFRRSLCFNLDGTSVHLKLIALT